MDNAQQWALIVGFFSPLAISVVNRPSWSTGVRTFVAVLIAVLIGVGSAYFAGNLAGHDVVTAVMVAVIASISAYKSVFNQMAPALELATTPKAQRALRPVGR